MITWFFLWVWDRLFRPPRRSPISRADVMRLEVVKLRQYAKNCIANIDHNYPDLSNLNIERAYRALDRADEVENIVNRQEGPKLKVVK